MAELFNIFSRPYFRIHMLWIAQYQVTLLTLILLTWRIRWAPNNASRWQMGFNSAFKGLNLVDRTTSSKNITGFGIYQVSSGHKLCSMKFADTKGFLCWFAI